MVDKVVTALFKLTSVIQYSINNQTDDKLKSFLINYIK
jgi:hypothetical protein